MLNFISPRTKKFAIIGLGAVLVLGGGAWATCAIQTKRAISSAEALLQKGYGALAAERIDKYRHAAIGYEKGCEALLGSYYSARRLERLEWAAQACLEAGKDSAEVYLGLAAHRELTGRDNEALRILGGVAQKFDKIPDIYYRMAQILQRNKNHEAAAGLVMKATERAPGANQIVVDALEYFSALERWNEARMMADRLKAAPTEDPELKLMIARALKKGGDAGSAQAIIDHAKTLLAANPQARAGLEKKYADLLGGAHSPSNVPPSPPELGGPPPGMPQGMPPAFQPPVQPGNFALPPTTPFAAPNRNAKPAPKKK